MKISKLDHSKIVYVTAHINYCELWLELDPNFELEEYITAITLKRLIPRLEIPLVRINKGIAINPKFFEKIEGKFIILTTGAKLEISRRRLSTVKKILNENIY